MLYHAYQAQMDMMLPARTFAGLVAGAGGGWAPWLSGTPLGRRMSAVSELVARTGLSHRRPAFGIDTVMVGDREVAVREEAADVTPFGTLLHFAKDDPAVDQPRVLLVAPLSGHFATLLRGTVRTLLREHDVYLTDWHNARDIPRRHGSFGFDDYVEHLIRFQRHVGPGSHMVAVCQPCVPALAAVAVMADGGDEARPRSLTLMAGPIDTRVSPTKVNELAATKPIAWFERHLITTVPARYPGAFRRVYPGFLQVAAFVNMNLRRHVAAHRNLFGHLVDGDRELADAVASFYDEYFAVLDMPAEFYLETVRVAFQDHLLPEGRLEWRGRHVDPGAIGRGTALLTVEGERDDVCGVGQTAAAHELCTGIAADDRRHHLQAGVGHYGVFSGRRWEAEVYPVVRDVIAASA